MSWSSTMSGKQTWAELPRSTERLDRPRVGGVHQTFNDLLFSRREQKPQHDVVGGARRIVDEYLLDEACDTMLNFIDEAQLVGIDCLFAARAVEIACLERQLVHEMRQKPRLVDR